MMVAFLPVNVDFRPDTGTVHLKGACEGRNFDIQVSRAIIESLLGAKRVNKKNAEAAISRHTDRLQRAAAIALARSEPECRDFVIELEDYMATKVAFPASRRAGKTTRDL
jgi:hypothetical protein